MFKIEEMDYFGYTPQFLTSGGENKYRSKLGGITFILFLGFAIYYLISKFINYIGSINIIETSRDLLKPANDTLLNIDDIYFGLGMINFNYTEYNISDFPYLKLTMMIVSMQTNGSIRMTNIPLDSCNYSLFVNSGDSLVYKNDEEENLRNKTQYYVCPKKDFKMTFTPYLFAGQNTFLQINLDFTNTSILDVAKNNLQQLKPKLNIIYKNIYVNSENKTHPFSKYIDNFWGGIDYEISKKTEFILEPFQMLDDDNIFGATSYNPFKSLFPDQPNKTIYQVAIKTTRFDTYFDRRLNIQFNDNKPYLNLYKLMICLNQNLKQTMRSYKKFSVFLAEITSILSNLFMILALIMIKYNEIQGKNNMILSMFSYDSIENLKSFKEDFKPIFMLKQNQKYTKRKPIIQKNSILNNLSSRFLNDYESKVGTSIIEENSKEPILKNNTHHITFKIPDTDKPFEDLPEDSSQNDSNSDKSKNLNEIKITPEKSSLPPVNLNNLNNKEPILKNNSHQITFKIPEMDKPLEDLPEDSFQNDINSDKSKNLNEIKIIPENSCLPPQNLNNTNELASIRNLKSKTFNSSRGILVNSAELQLPANFTILDDIIETILNEKMEFSFIDYIKSICHSNTKRNKFYLNAIENMDLIMDIEKYLKFNVDMTLVKEVLLDDTQRLVFDSTTKLINVKRFFEKNKESYFNFTSYKKEDFEQCFNGIKTMFSRNNKTDNKIIKFLEKRLEN